MPNRALLSSNSFLRWMTTHSGTCSDQDIASYARSLRNARPHSQLDTNTFGATFSNSRSPQRRCLRESLLYQWRDSPTTSTVQLSMVSPFSLSVIDITL